jgi:hypothetical protein
VKTPCTRPAFSPRARCVSKAEMAWFSAGLCLVGHGPCRCAALCPFLIACRGVTMRLPPRNDRKARHARTARSRDSPSRLLPVMEGRRDRARRGEPPRPALAAARAHGRAADRRAVLRLRRRSKYILADLDGGETLIVHLGMSGRMLISRGASSAGSTTPTPRRKSTTTSCSTPRRARASPSTTPAASARWTWRRPPRSRRTGCWRPRARAAGQRLHEAISPRASGPRTHAGQGRAARPANRRGAGQHLCLRGAAPGRDLALRQAGSISRARIERLVPRSATC